MILTQRFLDGIAAGTITLAFRRWRRPTVRAGGRLRTAIGVLAIEAVDVIEEQDITEQDARCAGHASRAALLEALEAPETRGWRPPRRALKTSGDVGARDVGGRDVAAERDVRSGDGDTASDDIRSHGAGVSTAGTRDLEARNANAREAGHAGTGLSGGTRLYRIALRLDGPDPRAALRARDTFTDDEQAVLARRLARLDAASPHGPWTTVVLRTIAQRPGVRAAALAATLGRETLSFKTDVRKLKELGLTESLEIGYRLSPRGVAWLDRSPA